MAISQLAPLHEWDLEYVKNLPCTELEWLDFKDSRWLGTDDKTFRDMSPYISAFSNYSGGYLVIGCSDPKSGHPVQFDTGVELNLKGGVKEWLEDKIPGLVDPPVSRIEVAVLPFAPGGDRGLVVIRIAPSDEAPHQAKDKIFYQRVGTKNRALGTQQIMDVRNRQRHPIIGIRMTLTLFQIDDADRPHGNLLWEVENLSDVFCRHVAVVIRAPSMIDGRALAYLDSTMERMEDCAELSCVRLSKGNGANPLFPRGKLHGRFPVSIGTGGWTPPHETTDSFHVKVFADSAPVREFVISQSDIATILVHPRGNL